MNDAVKRLEEKIAYLERHVVEQDKTMFEFAAQLTSLRRELILLRNRVSRPPQAGEGGGLSEERPPHY